MTPEPDDLELAQARIEQSRARLLRTLGQVQTRLKPANLAQEAVDGAVSGVASVARKGVATVRSKPLAAAGIAGLIGLVMARGWIKDIVKKRHETPAPSAGLKRKASKGTSA